MRYLAYFSQIDLRFSTLLPPICLSNCFIWDMLLFLFLPTLIDPDLFLAFLCLRGFSFRSKAFVFLLRIILVMAFHFISLCNFSYWSIQLAHLRSVKVHAIFLCLLWFAPLVRRKEKLKFLGNGIYELTTTLTILLVFSSFLRILGYFGRYLFSYKRLSDRFSLFNWRRVHEWGSLSIIYSLI